MHRDERRASTSKRSRETEAEAVAFVVCKQSGLRQDRQRKITSNFTRVTPSCVGELAAHPANATRILNAIGAEEISAPPV